MPTLSNRKEFTAAISQTAAGSVTAAAAPGVGSKIVVTGLVLVGNGAGTVKVTIGTDKTGLMVIASGSQIQGGIARIDGDENAALVITSATSFVNGWVNYIIAPA